LNFPVNQIVRKVAGALAAGCSIIVKGPEETPASAPRWCDVRGCERHLAA
jgi:succinate-semialdehyde dehydrogenase/glutarate-semialdehyde dehydrogenase